MKKSQSIVMLTVLFWLTMAGVVLRVNRLWFSPVVFHWSNLQQPNATFRWNVMPDERSITMAANSSRSFKVQVPKKFSTGDLAIVTQEGSGQIIANISAPAGQENITNSLSNGGVLNLPLVWENIAIQTRTFNVDLMTVTTAVTITDISLRLRP